ncbi:MAG: ABC transporter permease [Candidatus Kapaibacterium sp.]|jgi:ABC-2 type transport system permease protein
MKLSKIYSVGYWEFTEKVRTKSFLVSLVLTPIIMIAMGVLPTLMGMKESNEVKTFAVLDKTTQLMPVIERSFSKKYTFDDGTPMYKFRNLASDLGSEKALDKVRNEILEEELTGLFIIPQNVFTEKKAEYYGLNVANVRETERFFSMLEETIISLELGKNGIDSSLYAKISTPIDKKLVKVTADGQENETDFLQQFASGYGAIIIVMILVITSAQLLVRSLLEEKNNRIMEILLSSCSPTELMFGKLAGLGTLGLFQAIVWMGMAVITGIVFEKNFINIANLPIILLFGISGFLLFASLMIGIGSSVTTEQEAQNITGYIVMLAVLPVVFILPILQEPSGTIATVLSYIPFTAPMIMSSRIMLQTPPLWEIALSLASIYSSMILFMFISAKIFRVGVLAYGKRLTLPEIIKLLREK